MVELERLTNLSGRCALVTGANGGLGRVFAESLAGLNADLILVDLPSKQFVEFSSQLETKFGITVVRIECDLEIQLQRSFLIKRVLDLDFNLHVLVNCAAFVGSSNLQGWNEPFENQTIESWRRALEVNLTAIFDLCQGLYPKLKDSSNASIINIASIYGLFGPDWKLYEGTPMNNPAAYSASKGGLIQLTRWLATTISPEVRVNAISPGGIFRNQPVKFVQRYEEKTPLGRMASEEDFIGALIYLATDLSRYVTGQVLQVDGGWGLA